MRILSFLCFTLALVSCSSAKKSQTPLGTPGQPKIVVPTAPPLEIRAATKDTPALLAQAITVLGDNRAPRFSPDGSKILFLSGGRPSHRQAQVYELELLRMTERRVTFHDGDDEGASWAGASKIVYSSVTDEIKETVSLDRLKAVYEAAKSSGDAPNGLRPAPKIANGGDIYLQRLDGRQIDRITEVAGPDISPTSDGRRIVFVSAREGDPRLYLWNGKSTRAVSHGPDFAPAFSPDGRSLVWQRSLSNDGKTQLFMSENFHEAIPLTSPGFTDQQPQWNAKGDAVVFSSNRGGKTFDLYLVDRKASCLKRLTEVQVDLTWPTLSPDGSKIAFVAKNGGQNQIYMMDDRSAALPCVTVPASKP